MTGRVAFAVRSRVTIAWRPEETVGRIVISRVILGQVTIF